MSHFNIRWIERTQAREAWKTTHRILRRTGHYINDYHDELEHRVKIKALIDKYTEDGEICLVESGMDCDCVSYCHSSIRRGYSVMQFILEQRHMYEWADGPCNLALCPPSERPDNYSRDLAMEAYENGHPHYITSATV